MYFSRHIIYKSNGTKKGTMECENVPKCIFYLKKKEGTIEIIETATLHSSVHNTKIVCGSAVCVL